MSNDDDWDINYKLKLLQITLFVIFLLVVFIIWTKNRNKRNKSNIKTTTIPMISITNPFVIKIASSNFSDDPGKVNFELENLNTDCIVMVLRNVNIADLHRNMTELTIRDLYFIWNEICTISTRYSGGKHEISVNADLGESPSSSGGKCDNYPLFVAVIDQSALDVESFFNAKVVGSFYAIHVKTEDKPAPTQIIYSWIKMSNGDLKYLQPYYVTSANATSEPLNEGSCCVCMTEPICVSFMPCRHRAVCEHCYQEMVYNHQLAANQAANYTRTHYPPLTCPVCRNYVDFVHISQPSAAPVSSSDL